MAGETFTLTAAVTPGNATNSDVVWTSSSTTVATVNDAGVVTAVSTGDATITVTTADGSYTATCTVSVLYVIDFEDPRVADYLAGPNSYGANLYSSYTGADRYTGYDDAATGLFMMINDPYDTGDPDFYSGGIAISQWNDMTTAGYTNQCSVYYSDATTGKGGYKGSNTFAVHFGYNDPTYNDGRSYITFYDDTKECIFDHFYVTNNTYAVLSMRNGDSFAKIFSYEDKDWFKLVIEGIDKSGNSTGFVEFFLSDFRTPTSPGIITEWTKVDLRPLGEVTAIRFDVQGSDDNGYGLATPAYFCFDNLAVKL
jgi:hypothetical protein